MMLISFCKSQEIIQYNNDTLVTITPKDVKTINSIIVDLETTKRIARLQREIIVSDSISKLERDSVMKYQTMVFDRKENHYINSINSLENNLQREKRKRKICTSVLSFVAIIFGLIAIK